MITNWAGTLAFTPRRVESPDSVDALRRVVAGSAAVRVLGAGHSFRPLVVTTGTLIKLDALPAAFTAGPRAVRVGAGVRLAELTARLHAHGLALPVMPSLPHITVAGAVATATHGSGDALRPLSDLVESLDLVTADGGLVVLRRGDPEFGGAVVSLGELGVVVALELAVVPAFDVEQRVYEDVPFAVLVERFDEVFASAYSVSAFTRWRGDARLWVKRRVADPPADLAWAGREARGPRHPVDGQPARHCTPQAGEPGPWHERLPHFRAGFTPSVGRELQSEWFVAREHAVAALTAVAALGIGDLLLVSELRTVAADDQWLSPVHQRSSVALHFTWRQDDAVPAEIDRVERALAPWTPRPHPAKLFHRTDPTPRRFADLRARLDPAGKFRASDG
ncbi:FAD-binding protein [Actinosynnema sp. NPDC047251]|uniref:FAD-binding protein n=1 Tax=Saccharothrix espanaensis TaxID=103731 RepID=UPI0002F5EB60|nr:FAD-binding protein [Saccharothrix espanaensis]